MSNDNTQPTVFLPEGDPDQMSVSEAEYGKPGLIGVRFTVQQPGPQGQPTGTEERQDKTYQVVRTDSGMTQAPDDGMVAWWQEARSYTVTTDPTALGRGRVAGVFKRAWRAAGDLMCIQKNGPCNVFFVDAPTAAPTVAGLNVIPSATAGRADCLAAGTAPTYPILGQSAGPIQGGTGRAVVHLSVGRTTP